MSVKTLAADAQCGAQQSKGTGQFSVLAGFEVCWGLCPLTQEELNLLLDWDRAGTEVEKLREAVMSMTRLCKFYLAAPLDPLSS